MPAPVENPYQPVPPAASQSQVEALIHDLARGRISTATEEYQTLKRLLGSPAGCFKPAFKPHGRLGLSLVP